MSPAGAALVASAPAVAAAHVPAPPAIQPVVATGSVAGDLASADAQLDATLTKASACTVDTECHSVAVGAKACGGPTGYRAYSSKTVSTASVDALAGVDARALYEQRYSLARFFASIARIHQKHFGVSGRFAQAATPQENTRNSVAPERA